MQSVKFYAVAKIVASFKQNSFTPYASNNRASRLRAGATDQDSQRGSTFTDGAARFAALVAIDFRETGCKKGITVTPAHVPRLFIMCRGRRLDVLGCSPAGSGGIHEPLLRADGGSNNVVLVGSDAPPIL